MLRIKKARISGFRSINDQMIVEFPQDGAMLIKGTYKGSPAASGSGKSSVVMAVAYALGLSSPPATELKCKGADKMCVEVVLNDGSNDWVVRRDPKLSVCMLDEGGDSYGASTGTKAAEDLAKILMFSGDVVDAISYRRQGEPGRFLCMPDSSKKEFLSQVLGLDQVEKASDDMTSKANLAEQSVLKTQQMVDQLKERMFDQDFTSQVRQAESELQAAAGELRAAAEVDRSHDAVKQHIQTTTAKVEDLRAKITNAVAGSREKDRIKSTVISTQSEIRSLLEQTCPTCKQPWSNGQHKVSELETRMKEMGKRFQDIVHDEKVALVAKEEEQKLSAEVQKLRETLAGSSTTLAYAKRKVDDKKNTLGAILVSQEQAQKSRSFVQSKSEDLVNLQCEHKKMFSASTLAKGFLGEVFDEILREISSEVNDLMVHVPNISRFTAGVSSLTVSKSGSSKRSISVLFYENGSQFSLSSLSGGQRKAVDLCFDVAIAKIVRRRSGKSVGWFIMDEAMDGLDSYTKQCALDMIRSQLGGQIVVIDHSTEVQEGFASVITVEFDGKSTRMV